MKKLNSIVALLIVVLSSCAGSDTYQGKWKAVDANGNKFEIVFSPKKFSIKDSIGGLDSFEYKQNSVNITNSVETYGIQLNDGRAYSIHFPIAHDESKGLILDGSNIPVYVINRNEYTTYQDIYKLK